MSTAKGDTPIMMTLEIDDFTSTRPLSTTVQGLMAKQSDQSMISDFLYLERWEISPLPGPAAALRVSQIRRANPEIAEAIRRELAPAHKALNMARTGLPD